MASAESVVVGGGIASGAPFALGHLVSIANVNPPQVSSIPAIATKDGAVNVVSIPNSAGVYNAVAGATETFRVQGGMIVSGVGLDSVLIGRGSTAGSTFAVVIGTLSASNNHLVSILGSNNTATCGGIIIGQGSGIAGNGGGATGICIGNNSGANNTAGGGGETLCIGDNSFAGQGDVVIGSNSTSTSNRIQDAGNVLIGQTVVANAIVRGNVVIGSGCTSGASNGVLIGQGATIGTGASNVVLGQGSSIAGAVANAIVLGSASTISAGGSGVVIGNGLVTAATLTGWFGTPSTKLRIIVIGEGDTVVSPPDRTIRCTNASGADNAAAGLFIVAPLSTGAAVAPAISFQTGVTAASSANLQAATTQLQVDGATTATFTRMLVYVVDTGTLQRVQTINNAAIQTLTGLPTARLLYVPL